ncbi:MAG: hypothetical protein WAT71_05455 [Ignavibacteria bacterium]
MDILYFVISVVGFLLVIFGWIHSKSESKKVRMFVVIFGFALILIPLLIFIVKNGEQNEVMKTKSEKIIPPNKDTEINESINELEQIEKTIENLSSYGDLGNNLYVIIYNNDTLGYMRLPKTNETAVFNAIIQNPNKRGEESTDTLMLEESKDTFLDNIGTFIFIGKKTNQRLVVSIAEPNRNALQKYLKYGKDSNSLKYPEVSNNVYYPGYGQFNVKGWLKF